LISGVDRNGFLPVVVVRDKREYIPLIGLGDWHIGLDTCRIDLIKKIVRLIIEKKWYWIGMGDYCECATYASPAGGIYYQTMHPREQVELFQNLVWPIRQQCVGLLEGNHGNRVFKPTGVNAIELIARMLEVNYLGWEAGIYMTRKLRNAGCAYAVYAAHTASASKNAGLSTNWIERELSSWLDGFDIIMRGHSHDLSFEPIDVARADHVHHSVGKRKKYLVNIGHFCGRPDYIRKKGARPKPDGAMLLTLRMKKDRRGVADQRFYEEDL
jgi:hypothetical protein